MTISRNRVLMALAGLLLVGVLAWSYRSPSVPVDAVKVSRGPVEVTVEEDGLTRVRERYVITPPVSGFMQRVTIHAGDEVRVGQTLFTLEPLPPGALDVRSRDEAQARVARAQSAVQAADMNERAAALEADRSAREEARARPLSTSGVISPARYDTIRSAAARAAAELASARAAARMARFELDAAQTALRYAGGERMSGAATLAVTAPADGVVLSVQREDEGAVTAAQPVLTIGDPHSLEIVVDVLSEDAVRIRPGMAVQIERWGGPMPLEARVRTVEPTAFTRISALGVEEQRVRVLADLASPPDDWRRLGDAYRVEARFLVWKADSTLRLPHSCLFRSGPDWAVFIVRSGRAERRKVTLGQRGARYAQILSGVAEGDAAVLYPDDRIADGTRLAPRTTGPS
jgi:HlyD family secretion protein